MSFSMILMGCWRGCCWFQVDVGTVEGADEFFPLSGVAEEVSVLELVGRHKDLHQILIVILIVILVLIAIFNAIFNAIFIAIFTTAAVTTATITSTIGNIIQRRRLTYLETQFSVQPFFKPKCVFLVAGPNHRPTEVFEG
jgi:hypothetical protein